MNTVEEMLQSKGGDRDPLNDPSLSPKSAFTVITTDNELTVECTAKGSAPFSSDVVYTINLKENASNGAKEHFERLRNKLRDSKQWPDGNPLEVLRTAVDNIANTDIGAHFRSKVYSPTLGGIELCPISPLPAFLKEVPKGEQARDKNTGLLPPAFLLDEKILYDLYRQMGADLAVVSIDIQGLGALNEVGLGDEIDEFLKKLPAITADHFKQHGRLVMTREGGDEFLFMVKMAESGNARAADQIAFQDTLEAFSDRLRKEVDTHFANCDPRLLNAAEAIRRARLDSDSNHPALGVLLPYISARVLPYDEKVSPKELQKLFVKCRDENDKGVNDLKKQVKAGETTYLNIMPIVKEVDPNFPLKDAEIRALRRLHFRSEKCGTQFENAASESNPYIRAFHFHMSRMFASVEPLIPEACFRLNRAEDAKVGEYLGFSKPCKLNVLVLDVDRFGKWNTLLGSLGADVEVISNIVLKKLRDTLPYSIRFRERGGRIIVASRYTLVEGDIVTMTEEIEKELASLFNESREEFDSRAESRHEKTWAEIAEDDSRFDQEKHRILYDAGVIDKPWVPGTKKEPGSIDVRGLFLEVDPNFSLENFGKVIDTSEKGLSRGEFKFKPLIDKKDAPSRKRRAE